MAGRKPPPPPASSRVETQTQTAFRHMAGRQAAAGIDIDSCHSRIQHAVTRVASSAPRPPLQSHYWRYLRDCPALTPLLPPLSAAAPTLQLGSRALQSPCCPPCEHFPPYHPPRPSSSASFAQYACLRFSCSVRLQCACAVPAIPPGDTPISDRAIPLPPAMYLSYSSRYSRPRLCETRQCCSLSPVPAAARCHAARGLAFFQNQWRLCRSAMLRGLALALADAEPTSLPMAVPPSVELRQGSEALTHVIDD